MQREFKRTIATVHTFDDNGEVKQIRVVIPNDLKDLHKVQKHLTKKGIYGKVTGIEEKTSLTFMDDDLYFRLAVPTKEAAKDITTTISILESALNYYREQAEF